MRQIAFAGFALMAMFGVAGGYGPSGANQGKGGKYLVLPPGYTGEIPGGYIPLHSDTYVGYALLRSNLTSHNDADVAKSVEYAKRIKVYPLSQASSSAETIFTDAKGVVFESTIKYDASFFASLNEIVQREPWLARDKAMIDPLNWASTSASHFPRRHRRRSSSKQASRKRTNGWNRPFPQQAEHWVSGRAVRSDPVGRWQADVDGELHRQVNSAIMAVWLCGI